MKYDEVLLSEDGYIQFVIVNPSITEHECSWSFEVYEVNSWECDEDNTPSDTELYLTGFIKWDGCSHINFGELEDGKPDGYIHLCGGIHWRRHAEVMLKLWSMAPGKIKKFDAQCADFDQPLT